LDKVKALGVDYFATGHYANVKTDDQGIVHLYEGSDANKDQTYFLWGIDSEMLPKILFPLGELTKPEVRQLAKKYKLPTATKKDSQGICFVGPLKVRQFISSQIQTKPGKAVLKDGRQIADHDGVELYTIGQRLAVGSVDWSGDVPPLFVCAKDLKNNLLIVGNDADCWGDKLIAGSLNWLDDLPFDSAQGGFHHKIVVKAKIRYRQEDVSVKAEFTGEDLLVKFDQKVRAITAGQSIVFYDDNGRLLGGGIIKEVPNQNEIIQQLSVTRTKTKK